MAPRRTGLVIVLTGDGKGKTTAAFGQALRAAGAGLRVAIVQFIKGAWQTGEVRALRRTGLPIEVVRSGRGFTIERLRDPRIPMSEHEAAAQAGLVRARELVSGGAADLVVLDEIFGAVTAGLIGEADVLALLEARRPETHLVLTGRAAPEAVVARADLVSEVRLVKHPYVRGVRAQRGIEF
ncbi:MAG: cob(I)yrinic acid a,c-diamide adenosyltransferase [Anaerolinea sp.]|nr:cob(I)yrinic acid a,c-diamide adenosyltransferase [Anaerolinea sp.]